MNKTLAKSAATAAKKVPAKAAPAKAAVAAPTVKAAPKPSTRAASHTQPMPDPAPLPLTNRFSDRFAPRPSARCVDTKRCMTWSRP